MVKDFNKDFQKILKKMMGKPMDLKKMNKSELNLLYHVSLDQGDEKERARIKAEYKRRF